MSLTDAERRGARWLALLFVLGTITDAHRPGAVHAALREAAQVSPASPLDLNRATVEDLDRLPGIGPVLARRIVEHRERHGAFRSVDELLGVPGIGARSLERLRPHVEARSR
jgi:competence protein ComEA